MNNGRYHMMLPNGLALKMFNRLQIISSGDCRNPAGLISHLEEAGAFGITKGMCNIYQKQLLSFTLLRMILFILQKIWSTEKCLIVIDVVLSIGHEH